MPWGIALFNGYPEKVSFLDTTLRDGEQTPGVSLTPPKKLEIAQALDGLGVEVIEAGFAAVSPGEKEAIQMISQAGLHAEICSAARSVVGDVEQAIEAGVDSVNIIVPVSELHTRRKFNKPQEWVLGVTREVVGFARDAGLLVEVCLEDGSRTDLGFLEKVTRVAVEAGASRVTPCDTVGALTPEASYRLYGRMRQAFPDLVLGVHVHDDFGLATANTLAAVAAGATHIHATVNGLGERAGNASLEEVATALEVLYGVETGVKLEGLNGASRTVSRVTGIPVQPNKAIVGQNAFTHESGIHTHAILKDPKTYEALDPALVGATRRIVSGKHAGAAGLQSSLRRMGLKPTEEQFQRIMEEVKRTGDQGRLISDTDLYELATKVMGVERPKPLALEEFIVTTGNRITPTASIKLGQGGRSLMEAAVGNGPVDATLNALDKAVKLETPVELELYQVEAITGGTDAAVNVEVRLRQGDQVVSSRDTNTDIVHASVNAYLKGVNLLHHIQEASRQQARGGQAG